MKNIGEELVHMEGRFKVRYDSKTGVWRILDAWHDDMKKVVAWEQEISDDSPAVVLISDLAFQELMREAGRIGVLDNIALSRSKEPSQEETLTKDYEMDDLRAKNDVLFEELYAAKAALEQIKTQPQRSEEFELKKQVIDNLMKLGLAEDIRKID